MSSEEVRPIQEENIYLETYLSISQVMKQLNQEMFLRNCLPGNGVLPSGSGVLLPSGNDVLPSGNGILIFVLLSGNGLLAGAGVEFTGPGVGVLLAAIEFEGPLVYLRTMLCDRTGGARGTCDS